jgi:hypothetical protein
MAKRLGRPKMVKKKGSINKFKEEEEENGQPTLIFSMIQNQFQFFVLQLLRLSRARISEY